jgi:hypothetical protein
LQLAAAFVLQRQIDALPHPKEIIVQPSQQYQTTQVQTEYDQAQSAGKAENFLGGGVFKSKVSDHSEYTDQVADLYAMTHQISGFTYLVALTHKTDLSQIGMASGWKAELLSVDGMWVPGACASKPSWVIDSRYILIDDGAYYVMFDIQTKKFTTFGYHDDINTDTESMLAFTIENGKASYYIDSHDPSGPLQTNSIFKHSRHHDKKYVVRRELNLADMTYSDYKVQYPDIPFDYYLISAVKDQDGAVNLRFNSDLGAMQYYTISSPDDVYGKVQNDAVATLAEDLSYDSAAVVDKSGDGDLAPIVAAIPEIRRNITEDYKQFIGDDAEVTVTTQYGSTTVNTQDYFNNLNKYSLSYYKSVAPRIGLGMPFIGNFSTYPAVYNTSNKQLSIVINPNNVNAWLMLSIVTLGVL